MLVNGYLYPSLMLGDAVDVLYHGLPLDMSMAGYLMLMPCLLLISSIWIKPQIIANILNVYFAIAVACISIVAVTDTILYPYWGFHFDSSIFLYLKSPKGALASASTLQIVVGFATTIALIMGLFYLYILLIRRQIVELRVPKSIGKTSLVLLILTALLILPIRGGVSVSTMNIGKAYFSDTIFLNHAAINPEFNLMYSLFKSDDFDNEYQFYDKAEAQNRFNGLHASNRSDSIVQVLSSQNPNIFLFILESFSSEAVKDSLVAPNMHRFAKEGIEFTNFYANSFRTDRGLVSILSGYPGHPTAAIMKYPQKTQSLPSITRSLKDKGYNLSFYYGGDADFANMRSYFIGTCGISDITSDKNFPIADQLTKWGVPDNIVLNRVSTDLTTKGQKEPFCKTILTLSSHEPFDIPTHKFEDKYLNAIAYSDSCLGIFVDRLKTTEYWQNSLIIFVADHAMQSYPTGVNNYDPSRFHIPMIWMGGAVKSPLRIDDYGSQNDLAATLLSQLQIDYSKFTFSKDMLNPQSNKFAFYSYVNGFSMRDGTGSVIYDNDRNAILSMEGDSIKEKQAKAYFQMMYLDLGGR